MQKACRKQNYGSQKIETYSLSFRYNRTSLRQMKKNCEWSIYWSHVIFWEARMSLRDDIKMSLQRFRFLLRWNLAGFVEDVFFANTSLPLLTISAMVSDVCVHKHTDDIILQQTIGFVMWNQLMNSSKNPEEK